jgi:hypothetical protein
MAIARQVAGTFLVVAGELRAQSHSCAGWGSHARRIAGDVLHVWWVTSERVALGAGVTNHSIDYPWIGVHLFFVLSGFLLFLPYARWIQGGRERPSARLFYKRRFLRIVPAY